MSYRRITKIVSSLANNLYRYENLHLHSIQTNSYRNINQRFLHNSRVAFCSVKEKTSSDDSESEKNTSMEDENLSTIEKDLMQKNDLLSKSVEEYKDKYKRSLAEKENLRQRLEKQIQDSKVYSIQGFCKDLLEVSDVFRKAIESVPENKRENGDEVFNSLYDGVVMTENQLLSVFRRHGLERILVVEGDKFDPSTQEAMFEVQAEENKQPGFVAHVLRNGWKLHERCIRSAQVGVYKA